MRLFAKTEHACRHCLGRVLADGDHFECSVCGATCTGEPAGICGCGMPGRTGAKAGAFFCTTNQDKGDASPAEIVIAWGDLPEAKAARMRAAIRKVIPYATAEEVEAAAAAATQVATAMGSGGHG